MRPPSPLAAEAPRKGPWPQPDPYPDPWGALGSGAQGSAIGVQGLGTPGSERAWVVLTASTFHTQTAQKRGQEFVYIANRSVGQRALGEKLRYKWGKGQGWIPSAPPRTTTGENKEDQRKAWNYGTQAQCCCSHFASFCMCSTPFCSAACMHTMHVCGLISRVGGFGHSAVPNPVCDTQHTPWPHAPHVQGPAVYTWQPPGPST